MTLFSIIELGFDCSTDDGTMSLMLFSIDEFVERCAAFEQHVEVERCVAFEQHVED